MSRERTFFIMSAKIFLVLVLSLLVLALGFEWYLRQSGFLAAQPANYPCVTGDPELNHIFQKNCEGVATAAALKTEKDVTYKTNSRGTRGHEPISGKFTTVAIGDSYTEGFGLEEYESFPARLEAALNQSGLADLQVLNGGTLGYSPLLYKPYFERYFASLHPKVVLLNLDLSDFNDDAYLAQTAQYDSSGWPSAFSGQDVFPAWLMPYVYGNRFAVLRFVHDEVNQWSQIQRRQRLLPAMNALVAKDPLISPEALVKANLVGCAKPIELTARAILRLKAAVEKSGGRLFLHMYPTGTIVKEYPQSPQSISFVRAWDQKTRTDFSWSCGAGASAADVFRDFARERSIPFFDSFPVVLSNPQKEKLYFDRDAHWNQAGVKVVTQALAPKLGAEIKKIRSAR